MLDLRVLMRDELGKIVLLLGNEAIARGALEAGVSVVTTYPGTPASEIGDAISAIAAEAGIYMEYSTNEIVATEVAAGAANCGVRALTAMKHVGLNVASDLLMTLAYAGVRGGYVIVTADDPECYSSQNEQDNRFYALLSNLPCMEPSDPQEAKNMTVSAIEMSEKLELPVLLRTTTRVSHTRGPVSYGNLTKPNLKGEFVRDTKRLVMVPANSRPKHEVLLKTAEKAWEISENSVYNKIVHEGRNNLGIISSGSAYNYAVEAANMLSIDPSVLKLGMTHPLPEKLIGEFLRNHARIVIVEELEPYLEMQIKAIAKDYAPNAEIHGKRGKAQLPREGELSTRRVASALARVTDVKLPINFEEIDEKYREVSKGLPPRPAILCAGCPHRASFYVIRGAAGQEVISATDIGCYALGIAPPLSVGDIMICMGASVGVAEGIRKATGANTLAVIGDSTFLHAGIPGLINAVYNNHKITVAILDNLTTAMTGHQPHPGTGMTGMGQPSEKVDAVRVAEGCGVKFVKVVDPFKIKEATKTLKEALEQEGPSVVVFRAPCTMIDAREKRNRGFRIVPCKISDKCTNCTACIELVGCPALILDNTRVCIDEALCTACGLCASVCPYAAIEKGS